MNRSIALSGLLSILLLCAAAQAQGMGNRLLADFTAPDDSLSTLVYKMDGKETLNDACPVRKVRLNRKMGAAYVNDRPVGFC